ncbi:MAG: GNAT family N-acetyltransferase [Patescibacteria group bacterium]
MKSAIRHFRYSFTLRPFRLSDAHDLVRHINDPVIARNTAHIPYPYRQRDALQFLRRQIIHRRNKPATDVTFAIIIDGSVVGGLGLHHIEQRHQAELGYWLSRQYRGRGIMTRAVREALRYGFVRLHLRRIYAYTYTYNPASARVLEKNGFVREGVLRKHAKKNGRLIDDILYAKVRV